MKQLLPKQIEIDITAKCNLKCKYCPSAHYNPKPQHMPLPLIHNILDKCTPHKDQVTIIPWATGEPFLHPDVGEIYERLLKEHYRWYVTTNGHFQNWDVFKTILKGAYELIISLDGLYPSTIEATRPGSNREVVMGTIQEVLRMKKEMHSPCDVAIKICDRGQDFQEIENFIKYFLVEGVDFVVYGKTLAGDNNPSMRHYPCNYFDDYFIVILADGRIVPCLYNPEAMYNNDYLIDRIDAEDKRTLLEIYNSPKYQELRHNQRMGDYPKPCDTCSYPYNGKGWEGIIKFSSNVSPKLEGKEIYYHKDYYNSFFSLKKKWKPKDWYKRGDE